MTSEELAQQVAEQAMKQGLTVATAESLTSGQVAARLGAAPSASTWLRGAVVAYAPEVKFSVLGVPEGPVITEECARAMVEAVARLLGADLAVALTGAGGPDEEEGQPPGTVWFAVLAHGRVHAERQRFDGDPPQVVEAATEHALRLLLEHARVAGGAAA